MKLRDFCQIMRGTASEYTNPDTGATELVLDPNTLEAVWFTLSHAPNVPFVDYHVPPGDVATYNRLQVTVSDMNAAAAEGIGYILSCSQAVLDLTVNAGLL